MYNNIDLVIPSIPSDIGVLLSNLDCFFSIFAIIYISLDRGVDKFASFYMSIFAVAFFCLINYWRSCLKILHGEPFLSINYCSTLYCFTSVGNSIF